MWIRVGIFFLEFSLFNGARLEVPVGDITVPKGPAFSFLNYFSAIFITLLATPISTPLQCGRPERPSLLFLKLLLYMIPGILIDRGLHYRPSSERRRCARASARARVFIPVHRRAARKIAIARAPSTCEVARRSPRRTGLLRPCRPRTRRQGWPSISSISS